MDVGVVGCGYVGLSAAVGLACAGHRVCAVEIDDARRETLRSGALPFHEPGLAPHLHLVQFVGDIRQLRAEIVLVAVPTDIDHRLVLEVLQGLSGCGARAIAVRSTVAPSHVDALVAASPCPLVINPEFLREGYALSDLLAPDRLVLGGAPDAVDAVLEMYRPLYGDRVRIVRTSPRSAALGKLAANAMLAVRVSFANEIFRAATALHADASDVLSIVGADARIGPSHLRPSTGIGGPCLPKDSQMLLGEALAHGVTLPIIEGTVAGDVSHRAWIVEQLDLWLSGLQGRRIALLGVSFKPGVGDLRGSTALALLHTLALRGAAVAAHDPAAHLPDAATSPQAACLDADVIVIATPWPEYLVLDPSTLRPRHRRVFDPSGTIGSAWAEAGYDMRMPEALTTMLILERDDPIDARPKG